MDLSGAYLCIFSIVLHSALLPLCRTILLRLGLKTSISDQDSWSAANWLVSILQAALATLVGTLAVVSCNLDLLNTRIFFLAPYAWFNLGYWMYDLVCLFIIVTSQQDRQLGNVGDQEQRLENTKEQEQSQDNTKEQEQSPDKTKEQEQRPDNTKKQRLDNAKEQDAPSVEKSTLSTKELYKSNTAHHENIHSNTNEEATATTSALARPGRVLLARVCRFVKWWPGIVLHHVGIIIFLVLGILYTGRTRGDGIVGFSLLVELSSIFVALRSFLATVGLKRSRVFLFVSILMVATFFLCRILLLPLVIQMYCVQSNLSLLQGLLSLPIFCKIGTLSFYLLNLYWFSLMLRGCVKAIINRGIKED